jgi:hypothetical protein
VGRGAPVRLLCSILVRTRLAPEQWGMLAITVGVAVAECVESLASV